MDALEKQLAEEKQKAKSKETLSVMATGNTYFFHNSECEFYKNLI